MIGAVDQGHVGALYSTFQPPSTPSTIKSSSRFYKGDSVCRGRPSIGWLLSGRCHVVRACGSDSENSALHFDRFSTRISVLGPKALLEYAEDVAHLMECLHYHLFADDMQGRKHGRPADVPAIISALEDCATDVSTWCAAKRLQLNAEKTEVLWFGTPANLRKFPSDNCSIRLHGFHGRRSSERRSRPRRIFRRRAVDARPHRPYSTVAYVDCGQSVASSPATSQRDSSPPSFYHG